MNAQTKEKRKHPTKTIIIAVIAGLVAFTALITLLIGLPLYSYTNSHKFQASPYVDASPIGHPSPISHSQSYLDIANLACNYTKTYPLNESGINYTVMAFNCTNSTSYLLMIHNDSIIRLVSFKT